MKNLASLGLSPKDETVLKALVDLSGARTLETWVYTSPEQADVILLDGDNAEAVAVWERRYSQTGPWTILYTSRETSLPVSRHLLKPLRAADLIAQLNAVGAPLEAQAPVGSETRTAAAAKDSSLAQIVFDTTKGYLMISIGDRWMILNREHQACLMSHPSTQLIERLGARDAAITVVHSLEQPEGLDPQKSWHSDRSMLGWLGLRESHGQLLRHLEKGKRLRLTRWPPLSLMKDNPAFMNLSALLSGHSGASVEEVRERLAIPDSELVGVVNAAALCGVLTQLSGDPSARNQADEEPKGPATKGFLAKLRSRLGIGTQTG